MSIQRIDLCEFTISSKFSISLLYFWTTLLTFDEFDEAFRKHFIFVLVLYLFQRADGNEKSFYEGFVFWCVFTPIDLVQKKQTVDHPSWQNYFTVLFADFNQICSIFVSLQFIYIAIFYYIREYIWNSTNTFNYLAIEMSNRMKYWAQMCAVEVLKSN